MSRKMHGPFWAVLAAGLAASAFLPVEAQVAPENLRIPAESEYLLGIATDDLPERFNAAALRLNVPPRMLMRRCDRALTTSCEFGIEGLKYASAATGTDNRTIRRVVVLGTFQQSRELAYHTIVTLIGTLEPNLGRQDAMQAATAAIESIRPSKNPFEPTAGRTRVGNLQVIASGSPTDWSVTLKPFVDNPADAVDPTGMPYDAARRVFLARGWKPANVNQCAGQVCGRYAETENCQAGGECVFRWLDTDWTYRSVAADFQGDRLVTRDVAPWPRLNRLKKEW